MLNLKWKHTTEYDVPMNISYLHKHTQRSCKAEQCLCLPDDFLGGIASLAFDFLSEHTVSGLMSGQCVMMSQAEVNDTRTDGAIGHVSSGAQRER